MLDEKIERTLSDATELVRGLYGEHLVALGLYGSAAGSDYVDGISDINLVIVLKAVEHAHVQALRPHLGGWRKQRIATPLLLDRPFLEDAADVFPMELLDIQAQHRILYGENVFASLAVSDANLRYQCEHEARGKLLRLRQLYLEIGDWRHS